MNAQTQPRLNSHRQRARRLTPEEPTPQSVLTRIRALEPLEPTPQSELITAHEAASILRSSLSFVYEHSRPDGAAPRIPRVKIGGKVLFKRAAIDRFINRFAAEEDVA